MLGSYKLLNRLFKTRQVEIEPLEKQLVTFQGEISFLLETFFFVFLGVTFSINPHTVVTDAAIGILILLVLLSFRAIATTISTKGSDFQNDRRKIILMCAQGLTPATLAIVAVNAGLPLGDTFLEPVTYVIILTNVVTTAGSIWITRTGNLESSAPVSLGAAADT